MGDLSFDLQPVSKKPKRTNNRGSKYDKIIDSFLTGSENLVSVTVENMEAQMVGSILKSRISVRGLTNVKASVLNYKCFLEKI
jgi:hypothetical protein